MISHYLICALLLSLWYIGAEAVSAATYYVSPTGSDSNNGSMTAPFRSIQKAANIVNSGDTVIVKDGIYTGGSKFIVNLARGGTSGSWITFRAENKWGAVLDGQNNTTGYCWNFSTGANYVRVEDFEIKGCNYGGFWSNESAHDVYLQGNKVHHIHYGLVDPYEYDTGGKNGVFQGRSASHHTYDSNIFYTIGRSPNTPPISNDYGHDHGIYIVGADSKMINNVFYDLKAGFGIQVSPGSARLDIVNNTFIGPNPGLGGGGIVLWQGDTIRIQNNIFAFYTSYAITCGTYHPTAVHAYNNLTSPGVTLLQNKCSGKDITASGNLEGRDPKFVDSSNHDFHLRPNSPAIDAGYSKGSPLYDHDKKSRPRGNRYDIGAYEFTTE